MTPKQMDEKLAKALTDRDAQIIELLIKAPMRRPVEQHDVDGLGLFDVVRSPDLFG